MKTDPDAWLVVNDGGGTHFAGAQLSQSGAAECAIRSGDRVVKYVPVRSLELVAEFGLKLRTVLTLADEALASLEGCTVAPGNRFEPALRRYQEARAALLEREGSEKP